MLPSLAAPCTVAHDDFSGVFVNLELMVMPPGGAERRGRQSTAVSVMSPRAGAPRGGTVLAPCSGPWAGALHGCVFSQSRWQTTSSFNPARRVTTSPAHPHQDVCPHSDRLFCTDSVKTMNRIPGRVQVLHWKEMVTSGCDSLFRKCGYFMMFGLMCLLSCSYDGSRNSRS